MTLAEACRHEFGTDDRSRGSAVSMLEKVELKSVGDLGVFAYADGSYDETYFVGVDFSEIRDGILGVHCDCPRFDSVQNCKHLWATICKADRQYDLDQPIIGRLELYPVDPDEIEIGKPKQPFNRTDRVARNATRRTDTLTTTAKPKSIPDWKAKLRQIAAVGAADTSNLRHAAGFHDIPTETQHWFVISVSLDDNESALNISVMRSKRKRDGQWSRPVAVEIEQSDLSEVTCAKERAAISMLVPVEENNFGHYYRRVGTRLFTVEESNMTASLQAMHATGRLAWKLGDSRQHFQDAQPVSEVALEQAWQLTVNLAPNPKSKNQIDISPTLRSGDESVSVDRVIWVSSIGCALLQIDDQALLDPDEPDPGVIKTRLVTLSATQATQLRVWQSIGVVTAPRRSLRTVLKDLSETAFQTPLTIDPSFEIPQKSAAPSPRCALVQHERYASAFDATLSACYGENSIPFDSPRQWWYDEQDKAIHHRDFAAEMEYLESVPTGAIDFSLDSFQQSITVAPEDFLFLVETLQASGWEVTADGAPIRIATEFNIDVVSGVDWFDLDANVNFDGVSASLPTLLKALKKGQRTVILDDGTQGMLPQEWLQKFVSIESCGQQHEDSIRFRRTQALLLDAMLAEQENVKHDRNFKSFIKQLKSFEGVKPADPPKSFTGTLREYQRDGLGWFKFLQQFGFGGCLADDMGLGKTIQVLAMLDKRRTRRIPADQSRKPSIVVVPKSLVGNWIEEAARFSPKLRLFNYTGTDRRSRYLDEHKQGRQPHLLITTYGTLRNDTRLLSENDFDYVILDEAQAIKNPSSLSSKAARLLKGDHRLAMTGTPVENHLGDLWSLFDFLNPGMLNGGMTSRLPQLDDKEDRKRIEHIGNSLRPFILRRTKQQVLKDLPDKVEQTLACDMSKPQRKLYDELREHYRIHLSKKVEELGLKRSKIHVLEALLRLRQASCDPRLVKPDCKVRGAKLDLLLDQLEEIIGEGHKALVFSQFTSLLSLLRDDIESRGWNYEYLDGKTRKRADKVKHFQSDDDCQLFLISLKAGGTGLNLTAAQYVFILDPWWNPAVEAQAIDRAHRIGQTNSVNAYRLICNDSVEEKIVELQTNKRELADAIISQDK
ncbi:MAG: DEAD/DEAH box helicase, partial [Pirellulaceae bacterium]